jgi:uncharacterized protein (DUF433 family)
MSQVITLRLPDSAADALRQMAQREKRSINEIGARIVEEWLRQDRFAHIEFRTFQGERQACIKGRLQIWQVIMVAKGYGMDVEKTAEHLCLTSEQVRSAFHYYAAYPEEIEQALRENDVGFERLKEALPALELIEVTLPEEHGWDWKDRIAFLVRADD